MENEIKIGSRIYAVNKKYVDEKINGGRIRVCRVKTFENKQGVIIPVLTEIGNPKQEISTSMHHTYLELPNAIIAIEGKGPNG